MVLPADKLEQEITIRTVAQEGGIGVYTDIQPGFGDEDQDSEYLVKTLISVLWSVYPDALKDEFNAHIDKMVAKEGEV
jgi:hypothetical protein